MHELRIAPDATADELKQVTDGLDAFNEKQTGRDDHKEVAIALRDAGGRLVGGLKGLTGWDWMYISHIWVEESRRGQGWGSQLLKTAEEEGTRRGCRGACLTTFSFQARPFYERHGYVVFGTLDDYPAGETMYFMRKSLTETDSAKNVSPQ